MTFVAQTVTIGEQKVCPESESLKFSTTQTPQVENPSDSDSTALFRAFDQVSSVSSTNVLPKIFQICQEFPKDVQGISHINILPFCP